MDGKVNIAAMLQQVNLYLGRTAFLNRSEKVHSSAREVFLACIKGNVGFSIYILMVLKTCA